jgi:hypothetical protein
VAVSDQLLRRGRRAVLKARLWGQAADSILQYVYIYIYIYLDLFSFGRHFAVKKL